MPVGITLLIQPVREVMNSREGAASLTREGERAFCFADLILALRINDTEI